jgi:hypothetical protein
LAARVLAACVGSSRTDDARRILATELAERGVGGRGDKVELVKAQATPLKPAREPDCGSDSACPRACGRRTMA